MKLYPAIDILGGNAVRLVKGDFDAKTVYDEDPLSAALGWVKAGAQALHVVDLDGAKQGEAVNLEHLRKIVAETGVPVQYGGGLRSALAVDEALAAGASRVILGTAAITDPDLLRDVLSEHGPQRVAVSVDVREGMVATHGWLKASKQRARDAFATMHERGVRAFVFTNIDRDGMLNGTNREEVAFAARAAGEGTLVFSGGIGELADLENLVRLRAELQLESLAGVIVGKALYEERFTIQEARAALAA